MKSTDRPWLVKIAGPCMPGTGGDPAKIAAKRARLEPMALPNSERGHLPLIGEGLAMPILDAAGRRDHGDRVFEACQYTMANRWLERCDDLLRLPGASRGAEMDAERERSLGLPIVTSVNERPRRAGAPIMLAKITAKNQLTLPKSITNAIGAAEYFDVQAGDGQIILTPVRIERGDALRAKLAELKLTDADVSAAVTWSRKGR